LSTACLDFFMLTEPSRGRKAPLMVRRGSKAAGPLEGLRERAVARN
jgi:hypothetical protein